MNGYSVGDTPPGLADDGTFETELGRVSAIVDDNGEILVVDPKSRTLVPDQDDAAA